MRYRRTLSDNEKEAFAYELALGYYSHEELRHVFKLLPAGLNAYLDSEEMQVMASQQKRKIDESDQALRIHARKAARIAIDELALLVKDEDAPAKTRMEAGKQLREYAFAADKNTLPDSGDGEGPIVIRTNLDVGNTKGVYTVTADEGDEQVAEEVDGDENDDFGDLLGI